MSDVAETKPDPTTAPEEQKPETAATGEGEKTVTEAATETAEAAVGTAKDAAVKTSDTVFSMFGGGPKKEKKEETEEGADEPSGSSKAQKGEEVSHHIFFSLVETYFDINGRLFHGLHKRTTKQNKTKQRGAGRGAGARPSYPRGMCSCYKSPG